jgi:hypothetical protein
MTKTRHRDGTAHEAQLASGCGANRVVEWWTVRCRSPRASWLVVCDKPCSIPEHRLGLLAAGFDQRFGARPHVDPEDSTKLMADPARSPSMEILAIQGSLRQRRRSA